MHIQRSAENGVNQRWRCIVRIKCDWEWLQLMVQLSDLESINFVTYTTLHTKICMKLWEIFLLKLTSISSQIYKVYDKLREVIFAPHNPNSDRKSENPEYETELQLRGLVWGVEL
jgi:hypothetical protein